MSTTGRLASISLAAMVAVLVGGNASAQLPSAEQKCIDGYNNKLRLVSQQAGKSARSCIKNAGKGAEPNPDGCIVNNTDGKVGGKQAKVTDLYTLGKCTGSEPIQQGSNGAVGNAAHEDAVINLAHDIFGDPVSGVISPGKDEAKCQDKGIQRPTQAFTEFVKNHRKCKKDKMKAGTITDSATLTANCGTMAQIDTGGKVASKLGKVDADVASKCATVSLAAVFPGLDPACHASTAAAANCLKAAAICRACEAINDADGADMDCDVLDNGLGDGSCGIPLHKCTLQASPASQIQIHIAALPVPLVFGMSGALDIGGQGAVADCAIQNLNPINIPAIGFVCISAAGGCDPGVRHCPGGAGPALGVDVQSDGDAGACTSNLQCEGIAAGACAPGDVLTAACTGHCSGTTPQVCTNDTDCAGNGACNGPDALAPAQRDLCQVSCIDTSAHGASDSGDMQCNLGSDLVVETGAPCNGTDVLIDVGATCIPVSTQRATSLITDANFSPGSTVPAAPNVNDLSGTPLACATVDSSTLTGLSGVGAVNFFGSALGDLAVGLRATCL